jgi:hypothetical protein
MHNLGRGMWRRVGDFERIQVPQILRHSQLQQNLLYQEHIKKLQRHNRIHEYRRQILQQVNNPINVETELKYEKPINKNNETDKDILKKVSIQLNDVANQLVEAGEPLRVEESKEVEVEESKEVEVEEPKEVEVEESLIHEIIAVETELSLNEEITSISNKKEPIIFPKKGRKRG